MTAMKTSAKGIEEILSHEAIVPMPYLDSVGVWTVAVGHTKGAGAPDPARMAKGVAIPLSECLSIFKADLPKYEKGVNDALKVSVEQHVFDALVSFHYNTGAVARAGFVTLINQGHKPSSKAVCDAMMQWSIPKEIIERRRKEMNLMKSGKYSGNGMVGVIQANAAGQVLWTTRKNVSISGMMSVDPKTTTADPEVTPARSIPREPDMHPAESQPAKVAVPVATVADKEVIARVQDLLKKRGYHFVGASDGIMGPNTEAAIYAFRKANNLPPFDGTIDEKLIASLVGGEDKVVAPERAEATVQQAAAKSEPVKAVVEQTWYSRLGAKLLAIPAAIWAMIEGAWEFIGESKAKLAPLMDVFATVPRWAYVAAIAAVAGFIWLSQNKADKAVTDGYQKGKVL